MPEPGSRRLPGSWRRHSGDGRSACRRSMDPCPRRAEQRGQPESRAGHLEFGLVGERLSTVCRNHRTQGGRRPRGRERTVTRVRLMTTSMSYSRYARWRRRSQPEAVRTTARRRSEVQNPRRRLVHDAAGGSRPCQHVQQRNDRTRCREPLQLLPFDPEERRKRSTRATADATMHTEAAADNREEESSGVRAPPGNRVAHVSTGASSSGPAPGRPMVTSDGHRGDPPVLGRAPTVGARPGTAG